MSQQSEIVTLTITNDSVGLARAGFGIPLIVSHSAAWVERTRTYGSDLDVVADFAVGTPEYTAASAIFAQEPHPEQVMIGRASLKPTQAYTLGAASVANLTPYGVNVTAPGATPANPVSYTTDGSATAQEVHNGLITALNAVTGKNYTATFAPLASLAGIVVTADSTTDKLNHVAHGWNTGDGPIQFTNSGGALPTGVAAATNYFVVKFDADNFQIATNLANALAGTIVDITTNGTGTQTATPTAGALSPILPFLVTGNASGNWFSIEILDPALLSNKQTHADPGIATDLAAILTESSDWYALHTTFNSKLYVLAAAAWVESNKKLYLVDVSETDSITVPIGSSPTDTLYSLFALTYNRTAGSYHPSSAQMFSAAWMGRVLPDQPGSETWKFKTLNGVNAVKLSTTHRTNLKARKANSYTTVAGSNRTWEGTVAGGSYGYIDVTRGYDWLEDDMQKGVLGCFDASEKIPYTDPGIAVIRSEVKASLKRAAGFGIITDDFEITVPKAAKVSTADKAVRRLTNLKFSATLQGAIHSVAINGSVSV